MKDEEFDDLLEELLENEKQERKNKKILRCECKKMAVKLTIPNIRMI